MSTFNLFEGISGVILKHAHSWAAIPDQISAAVLPLITLALTITIMWQGYNIIRGAGGSMHLLDVYFSSLRAFFVVALALTAGMYTSNVMTLFLEIREWLTGLFTGQNNSYAALDQTVTTTLASYKKIQDYSLQNISFGVVGSSDFSGFLTLLEGLVILAIVLIYCVVAAINLIVIDVSLALVLAIGPLFVACLAFSATSTFFNNWLSTVLKYIMTAIFIAAIIGFANAIVAKFGNSLSGDPATMDLVAVATTALGGGVMLIILAGKAAAMGGEVVGSLAMQIVGLAKGVHHAATATKTAAKAGIGVTQGVGKALGYGAGQLAGRAGASFAKSSAGQSIGQSRAMQFAMAGAQMVGKTAGGTRNALSQRSIAGAVRQGASRGSAAVRNAGMGAIGRG